MKGKIKIIIAIILLFCQNTIFSQEKNILFDRLLITDGLSQSDVLCIFQDSEGFMWFGTYAGLDKYDGYNFTNYKPEPHNINSLSHTSVWVIHEDKEDSNILWIGTYGGLNKFEKSTGKFTRYVHDEYNPTSISSDLVKCIYDDNNGSLWVGTKNGLNKFDKKSGEFIAKYFHQENDPNSISENYIYCIFGDNNNDMWIGTNRGGLNKFNEQTNTFISYQTDENNPNSIISNTVRIIAQDKNNNLWLATSRGLEKFDLTKKTFTHYLHNDLDFNSLSNNYILSLFINSKNQIWIGTINGLNLYNPRTDNFTCFYKGLKNNDLSDDNIWSIYEDKFGIMWFGTNNGVNKYDISKVKFELFNKTDANLDAYNTRYLRGFQIYNDILFIAASNGLMYFNYDTEEITQFKTKSGQIVNAHVRAFCLDNNNNMWLATDAGLYKYNSENKNFIHFQKDKDTIHQNGLISNELHALVADKDNNIWLGSDEGLTKFEVETNTFIHYQEVELDAHSLSNNYVKTIYIDNDNTIWIGTNKGLNHFEPETEIFERYLSENNNLTTISNNVITSIFRDSKNILWIATYGGGINKFDDKTKTFTTFHKEDGLENDVVYSLLEDNNRNLWMSTNKGISKFNIKNTTFQNYRLYEGLQSLEYNTGAYYKAPNGKLFFGGINGFNAFFPDSISHNKYIPEIVITDFLLSNKSVEIDAGILKKTITFTKEITLSHEENILTFEFAALHYTKSDENQYAYRLIGLDSNWHTTYNRFATFTSLPPGTYIFEVKGSNSDLLWNPEPYSVKIIIIPPFYKTIFFKIFVPLFILLMLFILFKLRISIIKKQKKLLKIEVHKRTNKISQQNSRLRQQNEEIKQQTEELMQANSEIQTTTEDLIVKNERLEESYENIKLLNEIGQKVASNLSIVAIINTVYEQVNKLMEASVFAIGVYNKIDKRIDFHGAKESAKTLPFHFDEIKESNSLSIYCFTRKEQLIINDFEKEIASYFEEEYIPKAGKSTKSIIYLPLISKDKAIGVITVQSFLKNAYKKYHLNVLKNIAIYTSIALENSNTYHQIKLQNKDIKSSLNYAQTIQKAILPIKENIDEFFDNFIIYRPKDIVSGDFYWYAGIKPDKLSNDLIRFLAVVDCTGHGIPGAFMSMIGNSLLNEIVLVRNITDPTKILIALDKGIIKALKQNITDNTDGMDIVLCRLEKKDTKTRVIFSGAKSVLFYKKNSEAEVKRIRSSRRNIGGTVQLEVKVEFYNNEILFSKNDMLYFISDGIIDQNNPKRKRFGSKRLMRFFNEISTKELSQQKQILEENLDQWQADEKQRDDITLIGIRI